MASVMSTGLLSRDVRSEFFNRFEPADASATWRMLATRIPSTRDVENYKWLGTVPQMREWGTGRISKGLRTESFDVTNMKYEATIEVGRDEISDDQTGQIMIRVRELADRAATHKDWLIESLLNNGATSGYNSYDGVTFFNAAHSSGSSGSQSNLTTPSKAGTLPTAAEIKLGISGAMGSMLTFLDDQGLPMRIRPTGLVVVCHPAIYLQTLEACQAAILASSTNVMVGKISDVVQLPGLSSNVTAYLCKTDGAVRPFIFQDREPIEWTALDTPNTDEGFKREKYLYGVRARYRMTYGYWQHCVRMVFT